jgi:iron(III) transport system ATP-binding protein
MIPAGALGAGHSRAGGPAAVRLAGVSRTFGTVRAVDRLDLELRQGEMLALLGPSGCGKTTALRIIAGFEAPDEGVVEIGGRRVAAPGQSVPPERRRVGMVFQDLALFPHLSVADNVGYGIHRDPDRGVRVAELLELVGLSDAARRMPHELSGGMQQRVAVARALAPRPQVILLDEPFSSLDLALRTQLRAEVREILRAAGTSSVFVTHDQDEALTVADRVAVMARGAIEQVAEPEVLYTEPATPFVASFVGIANLLPAEAAERVAATPVGTVRLVGPTAGTLRGRCLVLLRPEHLDVQEAPDGAARPGVWRIARRRFAGSEIMLEVVSPDGLRVWCDAGPAVRRLRQGDAVELRLRDVETVAFRSTATASASSQGDPSRPVAPTRDGPAPPPVGGASVSGASPADTPSRTTS